MPELCVRWHGAHTPCPDEEAQTSELNFIDATVAINPLLDFDGYLRAVDHPKWCRTVFDEGRDKDDRKIARAICTECFDTIVEHFLDRDKLPILIKPDLKRIQEKELDCMCRGCEPGSDDWVGGDALLYNELYYLRDRVNSTCTTECHKKFNSELYALLEDNNLLPNSINSTMFDDDPTDDDLKMYLLYGGGFSALCALAFAAYQLYQSQQTVASTFRGFRDLASPSKLKSPGMAEYVKQRRAEML